MSSLLLYLLKSTASLGVFYLLFRLLMRRETNFALSRGLLLSLVFASVIVPLVQLPHMLQPSVKVELIPDFSENRIQLQNSSEAGQPTFTEGHGSAIEPISESTPLNFSLADVLVYLYLGGVTLSFLLFAKNILVILLIFRKTTARQMDGYRLFITDREIPSFAFSRSVVISQNDYDLHGKAILAHEQSHISLNHFYDLLLLELVKIIHWFNPAIYVLINDLKEIHEFQADDQTIRSGVDVKHYQLLIIQKGVGRRRFALANSFNHCQIKKRITMMNKSKTSKMVWWKVATFITILFLTLIACGKTSKSENSETSLKASLLGKTSSEIEGTWKLLSYNYSGDTLMKKFPDNVERIKFISDNSICWVQVSKNDHKVMDSAGGSYKLSGENYSEFIEYGGSGMSTYVNNEQKFTVKVENDKLYLSGVLSSGQKIREVWERVSVK